MNEWMNESAVI